jgi:transglutaminase-like putative cysteine protease
MRLRVLHQTEYRYASPVVLAQHLAHLRPSDTPGQQLLSHRLDIDPGPALREDGSDAFGNRRTFFALQSPHERLRVCADSLVETQAPAPWPAHSPAWESVRDALRYHAQAPYDANAEFAFASPLVPRDEAFADFARPAFAPERPLLAACQALMQRIHTELTYEPASTEVHTPALQALQQGKGVCQDFAHIMLGALRSLGLPGRYVSGYLLTEPPPGQPRLLGADASHAWVSVPWHGDWYDFDPTNNRCGRLRPGEDYVQLAVGRDFGDVSPLRGVIQGGSSHALTVAVTVAPPGSFPTDSLSASP